MAINMVRSCLQPADENNHADCAKTPVHEELCDLEDEGVDEDIDENDSTRLEIEDNRGRDEILSNITKERPKRYA